jgi:hypothetical protein
MSSTMWAALLAPLLGPLLWWLLFAPGRVIYRYLWRTMPEGKLRRFLLRERRGQYVTIKPPTKPFGD